jgi:sugar phosphate isomerase/epimerase
LGSKGGQGGKQEGGHPEELLLENTRENDLVDSWPLIQSSNLGICLDLGHLLVHGQQTHRLPGIWPRVRMVHLSAPGKLGEDGRPRDGHRSLAELDHRGRALLEEILGRIRPDCVLMLEVFEPEGFMESLNMLRGVTSRG